jgi:hypothetical protein
MKPIGTALLILGVLVGVAAGIWVMVGLDKVHLPWVVSVGLVKLIIVASFGIMGAGAVLLRLARKADARLGALHGTSAKERALTDDRG